jgi:hypothetical protein
MEAWNQLFDGSVAAVESWQRVPADFWGVLWPLALMSVSAYPMVLGCRTLRDHITSRLDRWLLAPLFGMAYYTLLLTVANALLDVPIGAGSFYVVFTLTSVVGYGWIVRSRVDWKGHWQRRHWAVLVGLALVLLLAGATRFSMTLKYPERLLDSDPYRHYPRTQWIVETGDIAKWEPWLAGELPIYAVQGSYVMAALLATVGRVDAFWVWKYGSTLMGALSAAFFYIFAAYFVPGRPRRFVGLVAAALVAAFSVHITRTNMGMGVPWSLVYLPAALLMFTWAFRYNSVAAGTLYGVFALAIAASNMVPLSMAVVFLLPYCAYQLVRRCAPPLWRARGRPAALPSPDDPPRSPASHWARDLARAFGGLGLGVLVFFAFIGIWQATYAGVPMAVGAHAHSVENMGIMKGVFAKEEDKAREAAQSAPNLPTIHRLFARGLGWHNTRILKIYMGHGKVAWGILAVLFVILVPAGWWRRVASSVTPSRRWPTVGGEPRHQWLDAKVFLLFFSLITLAEFALMPMLVRGDSLRVQDVLDGERLIQRLRAESPGATASVRRHLSKESLRLLSEHQFPGPGSERLLEALLTDLNRVIKGPLLDLDRAEFSGVEFRRKTRELYESSPEGDDQQYTNRLVIEDVFPEELARRDFLGFHFRTYTGRTYRYLVMPAYGLSLATAVALGMIVEVLGSMLTWLRWRFTPSWAASRESRQQRRARRRGDRKTGEPLNGDGGGWSTVARALRWPLDARSTLMILTFALLCNHLLHARGFGRWPPTSKPSEERALHWMVEHLPDDARIVCNWFNADFVRSYSARAGRPMLSIFAGNRRYSGVRINIRAAVEAAGLEIPDLRSTAEILEYARRNPGSYYVLKTRFGPWLRIEKEPEHFSLIATFSAKEKPEETVRLFELATNRHRVEPKK